MNHGLEKQQHESTKPRVKEVNGKKQDPTIDSLALIPSGDPLVRKKKKPRHDEVDQRGGEEEDKVTTWIGIEEDIRDQEPTTRRMDDENDDEEEGPSILIKDDLRLHVRPIDFLFGER